MYRLSDAQQAALMALLDGAVNVGMESLCGVHPLALAKLERAGLVMVEGVRKTRWELTDTGRKLARQLVRER